MQFIYLVYLFTAVDGIYVLKEANTSEHEYRGSKKTNSK